MSVNEQMVQDMVKEVVARLQIDADVSGNAGVFKDMNEAIEAAKKAQKQVHALSMDQREKDKGECRNYCAHGCSGNWNGKCRA